MPSPRTAHAAWHDAHHPDCCQHAAILRRGSRGHECRAYRRCLPPAVYNPHMGSFSDDVVNKSVLLLAGRAASSWPNRGRAGPRAGRLGERSEPSWPVEGQLRLLACQPCQPVPARACQCLPVPWPVDLVGQHGTLWTWTRMDSQAQLGLQPHTCNSHHRQSSICT